MKMDPFPFTRVDLHQHSIASDGGHTGRELVERAKKERIAAISITDHNTFESYAEAAETGKKLGVEVMVGLELDSEFNGYELHFLAYGFDTNNKDLNDALKEKQEERFERAQTIVSRLDDIGFNIKFEDVQAIGSTSLAKFHIIKAMMEDKKNREKVFREVSPNPDIFEVIEHYFLRGKAAYVPKTIFSTPEIFKLIHNAGGLVSLAHPGLLHPDWEMRYKADPIMEELIDMGLDAIEVYSTKHIAAEIDHYFQFARDNEILVTGGTDYHGVEIRGLRDTREVRVPYEVFANLKKGLKVHAQTIKA